jgi:SAM-dependent methyltransferase
VTDQVERERAVVQRMKDDWNARAASDAAYFIASAEEAGAVAFRSSGERDVALFFRGLEHLLAPDAEVVDIGCGIGRMDEFVAPRVRKLTGFDVSGGMVARARQRLAHLRNVEFRENDGFTLPGVPGGSVDLVFSHIVFQHVPRAVMDAYFHAAYFVLKWRGSFVFQVPEPIGERPPMPAVEDTWTLRFYLEEELREALEAIGFEWAGAARFQILDGAPPFNQLRVHAVKPV